MRRASSPKALGLVVKRADDRQQQSMQPGEGKIGFALHPCDGEHRHLLAGSFGGVRQQSRLADSCLPPHDQRSTAPAAHTLEQPVYSGTLMCAPGSS